ncbi:acyltransferase [Caulobacter sp. 17J80-11]|uniref:acyltransferase family protein n=1 Tax=Caulobacter sp. 17J80-11 TaxID=2763502 RepID=UPI001653E5CE|nr:acyltransferase [Caulobacter sp. 17J80-11]MBC6982478.1 acyltransferase [Caulobacter sp. 17J80-11]
MSKPDPLQSARGIAAMAVLLHHCLSVFATAGVVSAVAAASEGVAHFAVVFFFVLSGYVLAASLLRRGVTAGSTLTFYLRRVFRIYPALWVGVSFGFAYIVLFPAGVVGASGWFRQFFDVNKLDFWHVAASFVGLSSFLLIPAWSIFVELVGSVAMPAVVLSLRRPSLFLGLVASLAVLAFLYAGRMSFGVYLVHFAVGASLASAWRLPTLPRWASGGALLAAALLVGIRLVLASPYHDPALALLESAAALVLVAAIKDGQLGDVLRWRPAASIGNWSYSLYILHFPIMCIVAALAASVLPAASGEAKTAVVVSVVLPLSCLLAMMSYRFVELPGIRAGAALTGLLSQKWSRSTERPRAVA